MNARRVDSLAIRNVRMRVLLCITGPPRPLNCLFRSTLVWYSKLYLYGRFRPAVEHRWIDLRRSSCYCQQPPARHETASVHSLFLRTLLEFSVELIYRPHPKARFQCKKKAETLLRRIPSIRLKYLLGNPSNGKNKQGMITPTQYPPPRAQQAPQHPPHPRDVTGTLKTLWISCLKGLVESLALKFQLFCKRPSAWSAHRN